MSERSIDDEQRQSIEIGTIVTSNHRTVEVLGLSTESKFLQLLGHVESSLVGYAILVPGDNPPDLAYLGYLINSLKRKFDIPHVIATYQRAGEKSMPLDVLRYSLKMEENEQLVEVNVGEVDSIKHLLNQLIPPKYVKEPKSMEYETQNLAPSQDENV